MSIPDYSELSLLEKQFEFTVMVEKLFTYARSCGYSLTLGDAYRDPRVFGEIGDSKGYGEARSAHKQRLAIDLNLFKGTRFLQSTEAHRPLGEFWESIGGTWGGRFRISDGNHYSLKHNGIA